MKLESLYLKNFRNYREAKVEWDPCLNVICGKNGMGKSNLLEAVYYLAMTNSFRERHDAALAGWGEDAFFLEGRVENRLGKLRLSVGYEGGRKRWTLDGKSYSRRSELLGKLKLILFSPEDLSLVKGGPAGRRRFLNRQLVQMLPGFYEQLAAYDQVIKQRNMALRRGKRGRQLEIWDLQLLERGALIVRKRAELLAALAPTAARIHAALSGGRETLALSYLSNSYAPGGEAAIREKMLAELERLRDAEEQRGVSLVGPQRDDFSALLDGREIRSFGSQGQQRTAALALKLAQLERMAEEDGDWPLLLLDDVLSELDEGRKRQVLELTEGRAQIFISSADADITLTAGKRLEIIDGRLRETV